MFYHSQRGRDWTQAAEQEGYQGTPPVLGSIITEKGLWFSRWWEYSSKDGAYQCTWTQKLLRASLWDWREFSSLWERFSGKLLSRTDLLTTLCMLEEGVPDREIEDDASSTVNLQEDPKWFRQSCHAVVRRTRAGINQTPSNLHLEATIATVGVTWTAECDICNPEYRCNSSHATMLQPAKS